MVGRVDQDQSQLVEYAIILRMGRHRANTLSVSSAMNPVKVLSQMLNHKGIGILFTIFGLIRAMCAYFSKFYASLEQCKSQSSGF